MVFHPLKQDQISLIAKIQVDRIIQRLRERDYDLSIGDGVIQFLSDRGYDPVYGARPLKRVIQRYLENPLAQALLAGGFIPGQCIGVKLDADALVFELVSV